MKNNSNLTKKWQNVIVRYVVTEGCVQKDTPFRINEMGYEYRKRLV